MKKVFKYLLYSVREAVPTETQQGCWRASWVRIVPVGGVEKLPGLFIHLCGFLQKSG